MIGERKLIFLLSKNGQGAVMEFPSAFPLPDKKVIPTKGDEPLHYFKTDKVRKVNGQDAVIYIQSGFNKLELEKYATGDAVEEAPRQVQPSTATPERPQDASSPFTLTITRNNETGAYEAHMGVGSDFNKLLMQECGADVLEEFMVDTMADLRLKAKKKSKGYIEDTTELE